MIYGLEQYRCKENLPVGTVLHWTEQFFPRIDGQSANVQAHSKAWKSVYERITTQKHKVTKSKDHINVHKEHVVAFMQQSFIIPQTWLTQREQITQSMQNPLLNTKYCLRTTHYLLWQNIKGKSYNNSGTKC